MCDHVVVCLDNIKLLRIIVVKSSGHPLYTCTCYVSNKMAVCVVTRPIGNLTVISKYCYHYVCYGL